MKTNTSLAQLIALCCLAHTVCGQGTFQNLNFEAATIVPIPGDLLGRVEVGPAFPGWTVIGGLDNSLYNKIYLDSTGISIMDDPNCQFGGCRILGGNYTAVLNAGVVGTITNVQDIKLLQTGTVPGGAQSLRFSAYFAGLGSMETSVDVVLGGQQLSFIALETGTNFNVYAADIHQLAGQTAELDFILRSQVPHISNRLLFLDDIQFSDIAVPEPGAMALFGLGAAVMFWKIRKLKAES